MLTYETAVAKFMRASTHDGGQGEAAHREACIQAAQEASKAAIKIRDIEYWDLVAEAYRQGSDAPTQMAAEQLQAE